jgi:hypothetical protein
MPPTVKLDTCALPFQHQHIAPGDSCRADYSKLRLLCRERSTSALKAAQPNNHALLVCAVATPRKNCCWAI